jgi:hypothetical protein
MEWWVEMLAGGNGCQIMHLALFDEAFVMTDWEGVAATTIKGGPVYRTPFGLASIASGTSCMNLILIHQPFYSLQIRCWLLLLPLPQALPDTWPLSVPSAFRASGVRE